jgi:molecular chaperone HscC
MKAGDACRTIGIDLGTTYSLAAVMCAGRPTLIPNVLGEFLTPSAVSLDDDGRLLVGAAARARLASHPQRTAVAFKRDMGTDRKIELGREARSPEELSACVLAALKADAEAFLGHVVEEAVITVPAYFGELQRQATRAAGEIAGLRVERIINEPTAAALAYGLDHLRRESRAVVVDLGGGTFDVTVLQIMEGVIEIQSSSGDSRLGGEDFSASLVGVALAGLAARGQQPASDAVTRARLYEAGERAKRALSERDTVRFAVPRLELSDRRSADIEIELRRDQVEAAWSPLLQRIRMPVHTALRDAGLSAADIDEVLLVGGATRMPCVVQLSAQLFGRLPKRDLPPDESVALGAAIQAGLKAGAGALQDLVVTDVAPFSMGVAVASRMGTRLVEGAFSPILERGTVIPASRVETFATMRDGQRMIEVEIFQGEHAMCKDNTRLGAYRVKGIPSAPAGEQRVDIRFTYDLNGLLEVETTVQSTGEKSCLLLERMPGILNAKDIEKAHIAMSKLKFHPRESLPNRTALGRADALFAELLGEPRKLLGQAIASLRLALDTQQADAIDAARGRLVALTERMRRELRETP